MIVVLSALLLQILSLSLAFHNFLNLLVKKETNNLEYEHYLSSYVNVFGEQLPENTKRHAIMTQNGLWRHSLVTCARSSQVANREFPQFSFIQPTRLCTCDTSSVFNDVISRDKCTSQWKESFFIANLSAVAVLSAFCLCRCLWIVVHGLIIQF